MDEKIIFLMAAKKNSWSKEKSCEMFEEVFERITDYLAYGIFISNT